MISGGGFSVTPSHRRNPGYRGLVVSLEGCDEVVLDLPGGIHLGWADDVLRVPTVQIGPVDFLARQFVAVPWYPQDVRILLERDDSNQVTGLRLSCAMVRGVSFVRMTQE